MGRHKVDNPRSVRVTIRLRAADYKTLLARAGGKRNLSRYARQVLTGDLGQPPKPKAYESVNDYAKRLDVWVTGDRERYALAAAALAYYRKVVEARKRGA